MWRHGERESQMTLYMHKRQLWFLFRLAGLGWAGVVNEWMAVLITNGAFGCGLHFARLPGICNSRYIEKLELKKRSPAVGWVGGMLLVSLFERERWRQSFILLFFDWQFPEKMKLQFLFLPSFRERRKESGMFGFDIPVSARENCIIYVMWICECSRLEMYSRDVETRAGGPLSRFESDGRNWNDIFPVSQCSAIPDFHLISANSAWTMFVCLFSFSLDLIWIWFYFRDAFPVDAATSRG